MTTERSTVEKVLELRTKTDPRTGRPTSFNQIARELGISPQRAHQIVKKEGGRK